MKKGYINIPLKLIEEATQNGWANFFRYWIVFRGAFANGCHYEYSNEKLATLTGISRSSAGNAIKFLIGKGLMFKRDGNLCCVGINVLRSRYPKRGKLIKMKIDFKNQLSIIRACLVKINLDQQIYCIHKRKLEAVKGSSKEHIQKKFSHTADYAGLSNLGLSQVLSCSRGAAQRAKVKMAKLKLIEYRRREVDLVVNCSPEQFRAFMKIKGFLLKGVYYNAKRSIIRLRLHDEMRTIPLR